MKEYTLKHPKVMAVQCSRGMLLPNNPAYEIFGERDIKSTMDGVLYELAEGDWIVIWDGNCSVINDEGFRKTVVI